MQYTVKIWNYFFGAFVAFKAYHFKNIFDFTTAGDWDCVAAVERLPVVEREMSVF